MEEEKGVLVQSLIDAVNQIASISDYRCSVKKEYFNLARRLKLLTPMFEEIRESKEQIPEETVKALLSLEEALISTKELLSFGSEGSKIYLVLEREQIMHKFLEVTAQLEQALRGISYENLDISDEVKEQVELVLAQFRRAKGRVDAPDLELYEDLLSLYNKSDDAELDPDVLRRLAKKLQLVGIAELTQESLALHEMVSASGGDPGETFEKMSSLLKKIKDFIQTENPNLDAPAREKNLPPSSSGQATTDGNRKTPVIPDDFRCPISLELMKDPVIVSTGQLLNVNNKGSIISSGAVPGIVQVLKKGSMEARENAAATLFSLSVVDENKVTIGASGAIPPLVVLLSEGTQRGKKDAATALFNLCIYQGNKGKAVRAGVVPILMRLLTEPGGGMVDEALAILAILASHPEGKSAIGAAEAVPVLVGVIGNGSPRNRENGAAVLVHLCSGDQQHLAEAQELGVMGPLVDLAQNGTDRGKRKAAQLLERMNRFVEQQKLAQVQAEAEVQQPQSQSQTQQRRPPSVENAIEG
ncbi:hypothetical protein GOBAR_AA36131 [Gossypium barbadense]|uniref:RING-type E3 ubiquitin transferase n=1 Tax=Gossypium barbadense TaxID=3634 RepID=A0A2P5W0G5_GOSBA|nr:hypothetical protein GOBAR_AA36131 [Gossypium barbadense]